MLSGTMYGFPSVLNFICISLNFRLISSSKIDYWKPTTVSKALLSNVSLTSDVYLVTSDVICSILASRTSWTNLFCFNGESCLLSNYVAVPYESFPQPSDPMECMTKLDGCLYNGVLHDNGDVMFFPNCSKICQNGQWGMACTPGKCNPPFKQINPYGCFHNDDSQKVNASIARIYCQSFGADLWTFEKNQSLAFTNGSSGAIGTLANDYNIGIYGSGSQLYWINGALVNKTSDMWYKGPSAPYPVPGNGPFDGVCARTSQDGVIDIIAASCSFKTGILCSK